MNIKDIEARMARILDEVEANDWTEELRNEYAKLEGKLSLVRDVNEKRNALTAAQKANATFDNVPTVNVTSATALPSEIRASQEYRGIFNRWMISGKDALTEAEKRIVTTLTDGGVAVPESWDRDIEKILLEEDFLRQVCQVRQTSGDVNFTDVESANAGWGSEVAEIVPADPTIGTRKISSYRLSAATVASVKSLQNSLMNADFWLRDLAEVMGQAELRGFLVGLGSQSNQPTGLVYQAEMTIELASDVPTSNEVIDFVRAIPSKLRTGSVIVMKPSLVTTLRKLQYSDGGGYIWRDGFNGTPDSLDGFKVYECDFMPASTPAIMFQPNKVIIGDNGPLYVTRDDYTYAKYASVAFWAVKFADILLKRDDAAVVMVSTASDSGSGSN